MRSPPSARSDGGDAEARDGLGQALFWLGRRAEGVEQGRAAYALHRRREDRRGCARVAVSLAAEQRLAGGRSAAGGWLGQARRELAALPESGLHARIAAEEAARAPEAALAEQRAREALAIAGRCRDRDVEIMATARLGLARVSQGAVAEGLALLDEAIAAVVAGEAAHPLAGSDACCAALLAYGRLSDPALAVERCGTVVAVSDRRRFTPLLGWCRALYAAALTAAGEWPRAEAELEQVLGQADVGAQALARARLAALRVRQGRLLDAQALLAGCEHPAALGPLVELRLHNGELAGARALLERRRVAAADRVARAEVLPLRLELAFADGDARAAQAVVAELERAAAELEREDLRAHARLGAGRLAARAGRRTEATAGLDDAVRLFSRLRMPFEEARARVELARLDAAAGSPEAVPAAAAARDAFVRLGASVDADAAAELLRGLAASGPAPPRASRSVVAGAPPAPPGAC